MQVCVVGRKEPRESGGWGTQLFVEDETSGGSILGVKLIGRTKLFETCEGRFRLELPHEVHRESCPASRCFSAFSPQHLNSGLVNSHRVGRIRVRFKVSIHI